MNILWHKNPEIQKFCHYRKLAINPMTLDGNIYQQLMFVVMNKRELSMQETLQQVKQLYCQRLENLVDEIKKELEK